MKTIERRVEDLEDRAILRHDPKRPLVIMQYKDDPPLPDFSSEDGKVPLVILRSGNRPKEEEDKPRPEISQ